MLAYIHSLFRCKLSYLSTSYIHRNTNHIHLYSIEMQIFILVCFIYSQKYKSDTLPLHYTLPLSVPAPPLTHDSISTPEVLSKRASSLKYSIPVHSTSTPPPPHKQPDSTYIGRNNMAFPYPTYSRPCLSQSTYLTSLLNHKSRSRLSQPHHQHLPRTHRWRILRYLCQYMHHLILEHTLQCYHMRLQHAGNVDSHLHDLQVLRAANLPPSRSSA